VADLGRIWNHYKNVSPPLPTRVNTKDHREREIRVGFLRVGLETAIGCYIYIIYIYTNRRIKNEKERRFCE
jgi:hypothetical protein